MTDVATAVASPKPVTFNGREYLMSPLSQGDIGALDQWLRSRVMATQRASFDPSMTPEQRDQAERAALGYAMGLTWMSGEGARLMSTVEGWSRIIWQSLVKNHPKLTHGEVVDFLMDEANLHAAQRDWDALNGGGAERGKRRARRPTSRTRRR